MVIPCIDMKIILIGAGNLATQLAVALQKKGMTPAYIYSRTRESAEQLSERLRDVPYSTDISQVPTDGDLYIFAVKDSALLDLVSRMPSNRGLWVHTAGSMDMEVFAPYTARYGVFYPMQTFSKERETDFDDIPIFVETNHTDDTERLQKLAGRLSTKVYEATSEQRKYLHLAAVFACNFSNHLYTLSAAERRDVAGYLFNFGGGIGGTSRQTGYLHDLVVGNVVAHIHDFVGAQPALVQPFFENFDFYGGSHIDMV